ncbi:MAG: hypothetical protein MI757_08840 [Pirellulales bacterium]|nr:hypothetical protein [Pirellulales bacterium]
MSSTLDREEYVEQAFFFRTLRERSTQDVAIQEVLETVREEVLSTTKLPMAVDFMAAELRSTGGFGTAMARLAHYFTPFQTYVIQEAESDSGQLDMATALLILEREAEYRAEDATPQGLFLYRLECLCRNRMSYDRGLGAVAEDPAFDEMWRDWILTVRRQIGIVELADLIYVRSQYYVINQERAGKELPGEDTPMLFGEKEGRLALANREKEPMLLFSALHRQLGYPAVPRPKKVDRSHELIPTLVRKLEQLETRVKLVEDEQKGGIDLSQFYAKPDEG